MPLSLKKTILTILCWEQMLESMRVLTWQILGNTTKTYRLPNTTRWPLTTPNLFITSLEGPKITVLLEGLLLQMSEKVLPTNTGIKPCLQTGISLLQTQKTQTLYTQKLSKGACIE